jgi:hypothetical protein
VVVDQLPFFPSSYNALELGLEIALRLRVWQFTTKRAIEVVYGAEMVAILARDDGKLVVRVSRVWVQLGGKTIVSLGRAPVALLVLLDELGFAVAGQITEVNQGLMARLQDLVIEEGGDALARGCLGGWSLVNM